MNLSTEERSHCDNSPTLFWIGDYTKFNALRSKKDKAKATTTSASEKISRGALNLTMPGYVVEPLSGRLIGGNDLSTIDAQRLNLHGLTETWQFSVWDLRDMARALWDKISVNKWKVVESGTSFGDCFPYGGDSGMSFDSCIAFIDVDHTTDVHRLVVATESSQAAKENQQSLCFICDKMIPKDPSKRRLHIGKHKLKALRKVSEVPLPKNAVGSPLCN
jgi:hypothetical protein